MMQNSKFKCHSKPQRATPRCFQLRAEGRTNPKTKEKKKKLQKQHKKLQGIYELHGRKHLRRPAACTAAKRDRRRRQRLSTANQKQKPKEKKTNQTLDSRKGKPNVNETETKSETKPKSNDKCSHQGLRAVVLAKSSWPKPKSKHKVLNASGNHLKPSINQRKQ